MGMHGHGNAIPSVRGLFKYSLTWITSSVKIWYQEIPFVRLAKNIAERIYAQGAKAGTRKGIVAGMTRGTASRKSRKCCLKVKTMSEARIRTAGIYYKSPNVKKAGRK